MPPSSPGADQERSTCEVEPMARADKSVAAEGEEFVSCWWLALSAPKRKGCIPAGAGGVGSSAAMARVESAKEKEESSWRLLMVAART